MHNYNTSLTNRLPPLEILIVDSTSPEPVALGDLRPFVHVIRLEENSGPAAARNAAIKIAKGEIIAFLDDDCIASAGWLKTLVPCFQYDDIVAVGGRVESAVLDNPITRYEQASPLLMGNHQRKVCKDSTLSYLPTCNLLVRKSSLLEVGCFNPGMRVGEDVDLCWRLLQKGGKIYYIPEGVVYHHHRSRLFSLLKRRLDYGQSEACLYERYPGDRRKVVLFPGNAVVLAAAMLTFTLRGLWPAAIIGIGLALANILIRSLLQFRRTTLLKNSTGFGEVFFALVRAQGTAIYLYSSSLA